MLVIALVAVAVGAGVGLLRGGSLDNWAHVRFRWPWLIVAALVVRIAVGFTPLGAGEAARYVFLLFLAALVVWALLQWRNLPGVWLVALGPVLNVIVILANGVHMPVSAVSGYVPAHTSGFYIVAGPSTQLNWLGDWIGIPGWLGGAASPGDVVAGLGFGLVGFAITKSSASRTKLDHSGLSQETSGR